MSALRVWQIVKRIMIEAGIADAPHRSPKGLRHGFGINATVNGIPLHMLQKWMGHAQLSTTAIYANAVGKEEQDIASRMWGYGPSRMPNPKGEVIQRTSQEFWPRRSKVSV